MTITIDPVNDSEEQVIAVMRAAKLACGEFANDVSSPPALAKVTPINTSRRRTRSKYKPSAAELKAADVDSLTSAIARRDLAGSRR